MPAGQRDADMNSAGSASRRGPSKGRGASCRRPAGCGWSPPGGRRREGVAGVSPPPGGGGVRVKDLGGRPPQTA